jgi:heme exporter protein B
MDYLSKVMAIVHKDILAELRTKEMLGSMFVFALLVIIVFNFAFQLTAQNTTEIAPGVLWIAFTFSGVLGLSRSFIMEKDRGCLEGLLLCPVERSAIYLGKMIGNLVFMLVVEAIALPIFAVFFNLNVFRVEIALITVAGTIGFAGVGTLFSAISVNTRTREVMLPILFFPIAIPVIIAAVMSTGYALAGQSWDDILPWLRLIGAFDLIFLFISIVTFEFVVEE